MKGVSGELRIRTSYKNSKTVLKDSFFTNPFKIAKPFYNDNDEMLLYIMSSSPGVLEGDENNMKIDIEENSSCIITTQSYSKIFAMENGNATQNLEINIANGGKLKYLPLPLMLLQDSNYESFTTVNMDRGSTFIWADVVSCGRKAMGEEFKFKNYYSRLEVNYDGKLIFLDNIMLKPNNYNAKTIGCYEGYTDQGTLYVCTEDILDVKNKIDLVIGMMHDFRIIYGLSTVFKGVILRILGHSAEDIKDIINDVVEQL